jgi:hypothetical protein
MTGVVLLIMPKRLSTKEKDDWLGRCGWSLELVSASAGGIGAHLCDIVPRREKFRSHFTKHEKSARIAVMLKVAPIQESLEIAGHVQSSGKSPVLGVELR